MLGKLMKYELRATARLMLPLLLVVLGLGCVVNLYDQILQRATPSQLTNIMNGILIFAFVFALFAAVLCAVILMVQRFAKNLMGDEGYLMHTLPAGLNSHISAKLLVSAVWFVAVIAVDILAVLIAVRADLFAAQAFSDFLSELWQAMEHVFTNGRAWVLIELFLLALVSLALSCLQFYAPISIGHSFAKHKGLLSVVFFFVLQFVMQILTSFYWIKVIGSATSVPVLTAAQTGAMAERILLYALVLEVLFAAVLYGITWLMMKKRLNLQ